MDGKQFITRAKAWAKAHGVEAQVDASRGKGGHRILTLGGRWTTVQTGEIPRGTYHAMLRQLGIDKEEF